jgi:hypothetical protein
MMWVVFLSLSLFAGLRTFSWLLLCPEISIRIGLCQAFVAVFGSCRKWISLPILPNLLIIGGSSAFGLFTSTSISGQDFLLCLTSW